MTEETKPVEREASDEATEGRWQHAIYELCKKLVGPERDYMIDGGGCDSGDALDFTLAELGQSFLLVSQASAAAALERAADEVDSKLDLILDVLLKDSANKAGIKKAVRDAIRALKGSR